MYAPTSLGLSLFGAVLCIFLLGAGERGLKNRMDRRGISTRNASKRHLRN